MSAVIYIEGGGDRDENLALDCSALRQWPSLEDVSKDDVLDALERATTGCPRRYAKGPVSFELLERVVPARIEAECPRAKALLDFLRTL